MGQVISFSLTWTRTEDVHLHSFLFVVVLVTWMRTNSALSDHRPLSSPEAKQLETLVKKAAALIDAKLKDTFSKFGQRGSQWFFGDLYMLPCAPVEIVLFNPAFRVRAGKAYPGKRAKMGSVFRRVYWDRTDEGIGMGRLHWLLKPGQTDLSHRKSYVKAVKAPCVALVGTGFSLSK